jgi:predicted nucleotidyltransferase
MEERVTTWGERALTELFGSEVRAGVLSWICAHPEELIFGAKLARELGMSASAVGKELARLEALGMLRAAEPIGAAKPYTLNEQFPLLPGLRSVCLYATGVVAVLRELFADAEGVEVAAIFGSLARGDDRPESDVDVLVVGEIDGLVLAGIAREAGRRTGRDVMTVYYPPDELAEKAQDRGGFIDRVLSGSLIAVKGDVDDLRRLAEQREHSAISAYAS